MICAMLLAVLLLAGCAADGAEKLPMAGKKFAVVVKIQNNPYFESVVDAFCSVIARNGGTTLVLEPENPSAEAQITIVNELIRDGVDCIAIAANSETAVETALKSALAHGIKVLSFDSSVSPELRSLHIDQGDAQLIADRMLDAAAQIYTGSGQIAIMSTTSQAHNQNLWIEKMRGRLEQGQYPELTLVDIVYGEDLYDRSYEKTKKLLDDYPELSVIITPTAAGLPAVAQCILDEGRQDKVRTTGLGMPDQMLSYVRGGVCPYLYMWNTVAMGRLSAYAAMALVDGSIDGCTGETLNAGELGLYTVEEDTLGGSQVVLQTEPFCFNAENVDSWEPLFFGSTD